MAITLSPFLSTNRTQDRSVLRVALKQHSVYLSKVLEVEESNIYQDLVKYIKMNKDKYKSREAEALIKDKNEDRQIQRLPLSQLFNFVEQKNYHLSPSLVAYTNSDEEESINSVGTRLFIQNRSYYKGLKQKYKGLGDKELESKYDKLQNAFKIFNNAQSGAMSSEGTPINNQSGHTTLTSTTRCLTSTVNLINEQFLTGNRLYNTPINTLQSITARIRVTDYKKVEEITEKYGLHKATPDDVYNLVVHCADRYWDSAKYRKLIKEYLDKLNWIELSSILYTLDLASLYQHNRAFVTQFFDDWTAIPEETTEVLKPDNGDKYTLAISKLPPNPEKETVEKLNHHHAEVEGKYADLLDLFFKSPIPPTGLFDVVNSIRDCVLTSDTDSSIYTIDKVASEYSKDRQEIVRLDAVLTYFIRMISVDQHQQLSANMNVTEANLNLLGMKNEYFFGGYITTLMSKHYYALQRMVEGVMNKNPEMEIKGSNLKSAKLSESIRNKAEAMMKENLRAIEENALLNPAQVLGEVADLERQVMDEVLVGNWKWLTKQTIKGEKAYATPFSSVYLYHLLWESVFADKYGKAPDLPYVSVKVNVELGSKSKMEKFIADIGDKELGEKLRRFCEMYRFNYDTISIPLENMQSLKDMPLELKPVINFREIVKQNFKPIYVVLESSGLHFINDKITRLVSDEH